MPETITIQTQDGPMDAYYAAPEGPARGGMVVAQEAFGVNDHIKDVCRRLAAEGYAAVAPELFHRSGRGVVLDYADISKIFPYLAKLGNEGLAMDMKAALAWLRARPELKGKKVGAIGFCMGGFTAFLTACRADPAAAVCFYPGGLVKERQGIGFKPPLQEAGDIQAPILLFFGDQDQGIPKDEVDAVRAKLEKLGKAREIVVYPGAGHGFFCDLRPSYHPASAADAWKRTLAWLSRHVSGTK